MADDKPIIVIKKKGGHGGHHGGAWKVAYADFVTAMMAFFMVMWLVNAATVETKENIASYFRKPGLFTDGSGTPLQIGAAGILPEAPPPKPDEKKKGSGMGQIRYKEKSGTDQDDDSRQITYKGRADKGLGDKDVPSGKSGHGIKEDLDIPADEITYENPEAFTRQGPTEVKKEPEASETRMSAAEEKLDGEKLNLQKQMEKIAEQIRKEIEASPELKELLGIVDVRIDADGVNIEIMDTAKTSMFTRGSARILPAAQDAFNKLAEIIGKLPNSVEILGHTDSKQYGGTGYSNWELSADRANAARRLLVARGIPADRIVSVVGRAERDLRVKEDPFADANRRITLKMKFAEAQVSTSVNPAELEQISRREPSLAPPLPSSAPQEQVHSFTPQQINKRRKTKKGRGVVVTLPEANGSEVIDEEGSEPIFDSPVLGPDDHFANF